MFEITHYKGSLSVHPHFVVATVDGWKRVPAKQYPYTGKSCTVMEARCKAPRRNFGNSKAKNFRRRWFRNLSAIDVDTQSPRRPKLDHMDVDESVRSAGPFAPPTTADRAGDPIQVYVLRPIFASRTKPVAKAKFQKRVARRKQRNSD